MEVTSHKQGFETAVIHGALVSSFKPILKDSVPWIWILNHRPTASVSWWNTTVHINQKHTCKADVRCLCYDIQFSTTEFIDIINEFDHEGIYLFQSQRRLPVSLFPLDLPENKRHSILKDNGVFLSMYLPHACETSVITCYEQGYLQTISAV